MTPFDKDLAVPATAPTSSPGTPTTTAVVHADPLPHPTVADPTARVNATASSPVPLRRAGDGRADRAESAAVPLPRGTGGGRRPLTLPPRARLPLLALAVAVLVAGIVLGEGLLLAAGLVMSGMVVNLIGGPRS